MFTSTTSSDRDPEGLLALQEAKGEGCVGVTVTKDRESDAGWVFFFSWHASSQTGTPNEAVLSPPHSRAVETAPRLNWDADPAASMQAVPFADLKEAKQDVHLFLFFFKTPKQLSLNGCCAARASFVWRWIRSLEKVGVSISETIPRALSKKFCQSFAGSRWGDRALRWHRGESGGNSHILLCKDSQLSAPPGNAPCQRRSFSLLVPSHLLCLGLAV